MPKPTLLQRIRTKQQPSKISMKSSRQNIYLSSKKKIFRQGGMNLKKDLDILQADYAGPQFDFVFGRRYSEESPLLDRLFSAPELSCTMLPSIKRIRDTHRRGTEPEASLVNRHSCHDRHRDTTTRVGEKPKMKPRVLESLCKTLWAHLGEPNKSMT